MISYPKISNLYKKNKGSNKCIQPVFSEKIFSDIQSWNVYEKLDGMNITICLSKCAGIRIKGKHEKTKIPGQLIDYILDKFKDYETLLNELDLKEMYLFGEGVGSKIESGEKYSKEQIFILFDLFYKCKFHENSEVEQIAKYFNIGFVPLLKTIKSDFSLMKNAQDLLKTFPKSQYGDFESEGLILKPVNNIKDENNNRVMSKLRREEFILN